MTRPARLSPALVGLLVVALLVAAALLPAVDEGHAARRPGIQMLLRGWKQPGGLPWSANILLAGGLLCLARRRYTPAAALGAGAALLALTTPAFVGGKELLSGYYLWQASFILLGLGARVLARERGSTQVLRTE